VNNMRKLCLIIFCFLFIFLITVKPLKAQLLEASVMDSTGVVGLDLTVGFESIPVINEVFAGGPSERAGLRSGDRILAINNLSTRGLNAAQVDMAIPDVPGVKVLFTILRNGHRYNKTVEVVPLHQASQNLQKVYQFE
jgi:C-terminal processing protease CtpA/Prc